jgi:hypothetical protein
MTGLHDRKESTARIAVKNEAQNRRFEGVTRQ